MARYTKANEMAAKAATKPFKPYKGEFVAPVNEQQLAGIDTINNSVDAADPYFAQAQDYLTRGSGTAQPGELDIQRYMSPYMDEVVDSTAALIDQGNEQAMSGSLGDLIKSGGFGGDRAGIASAVLAGQQQMGRANTLSGLKQAGYQQAVGTAQQQQGTQLAADQADLARLLQASGQSTQTGAAVQQAGLAGGEAQINAGTLQQQTQQAKDTARYQQFLQRRGYPFQVAQFLANIAMGTGALSGSTTTTENPASFFRRGGRVKADGGSVYGHEFGSDSPYGGMSYVPEDQLKIGDMKFAEPVSAPPKSGFRQMKELWDTGKEVYGIGDTVSGWFNDTPEKATGGVVGASYLGSKPDIVDDPSGPLDDIIESQEEGDEPRLPEPARPPSQGGSAASGIGSLLSGMASIFALSDPKVKESVKRIGKTDDGMPIYSFKYKGQPHTHIGFMADEVQDKHPSAVRTIGGLKHVDLSKAHTFAEGGVVPDLPEGVDAPMPEIYRDEPPPEVDLSPLREAIASKESPNYYTITGGKKFDSYDDHPRERVPLKGDDYSTAAGRFQIIEPTWDAAAKKLGLKDFSPLNQNKAADFIAKSDYQKRTGSDLGADIAAEKYGDVRKGLTKTWRGLENLTDDDFAKFFEPQNAEYLPREDRRYGGGVRPRFAEGGIPQIVEEEGTPYGTVVEPEYKETPHRYTPPGLKVSDMDGETLVRSPRAATLAEAKFAEPAPALETRVVKDAPTIADVATTDADYPGGVKPVDAPPADVRAKETPSEIFSKVLRTGPGWVEAADANGRVIRREGARNWRNNNPGNLEYGDFAKKHGAIDTDGRFAVFPSMEDGKKAQEALLFESDGYRGHTVRSAISRYAPPSENNTGSYVDTVATAIGVNPDTPLAELSPEQRSAMVNAMHKVEGFKPGKTIINGVMSAANDAVEGGKDLATGVVSGVKSTANTLGDFVSDTGSGMKDFLFRNKGNTDMILSILSGLGTMASSDSRYLGSAMLQGLGGGAKTYADLQKQSADIRETDARTRAQAINSVYDSIKPIDGVNMILDENGNHVKFWDAVRDPNFRSLGGQQLNETIRKMAIDAYRQGKDPNRMQIGNTVQTKPVEAAQVEGTPDGGAIIQSAQPVAEPVDVPWREASKAAIKANETLLSQQPNQRGQLLKETEVALSDATQRARSSIEAAPALTEQATIVTDAIADKNIGTGGNLYADLVVKPYNTLARSLGWAEINGPPDADTQKVMLDKLSTINAQSLKPEDQSSYEALRTFQDISPNLDMTPQAATMITSQQMIQNQRAIDKAAYMNETLRQSRTGEGVWTSANESAFNSEVGDLYLQERNNIANLMQLAEQDGRVRKFMHDAAAGAFQGEDGKKKAQAILERLVGPQVSPMLYRYFQRG